MNDTPDEFDAVRTVTKTLEGFSPDDQKRILRWAAEKIGINLPQGNASGGGKNTNTEWDAAEQEPPAGEGTSTATDIKSFVISKSPKNDIQFAAVVAYYYRFEAKEDEKMTSIKASDLIDACRKVTRPRPKRPDQTLINTVNAGLLDKLGSGNFSINSVGENLVAVTLPSSSSITPDIKKKKKTVARNKIAKKKTVVRKTISKKKK